MLLSQQLTLTAQKNLGQAAIRYLGKDITYAELKKRVSQLSYLFQSELGHQKRVAIMASNSPSVIISFFALSNTRSIAFPLDPHLGFDDTAAWLKRFQATHLAVTSDLVSHAREMLREERLSLPIIEIERKHGGEYDPIFMPLPDQPPKETDIVLMFATSGATGQPKMVAFDHNRLQFSAIALRTLYKALPADKILTTLNWSHPFAWMNGMLFPVLNGCTCIIDQGLQGPDFMTFLTESHVTRLLMDPVSALHLIKLCNAEGRRFPYVKSLVVSPGAASKELIQEAKKCGVPIFHCYGQTENAWTIALGGVSEADSASSFIRGIPGVRYKVIDDNGDELQGKQERTGALAVSGPSVMVGYRDVKKEDWEMQTKMTIRGTWLYTGDIATLKDDENGVLVRLIGRKDELLKDGSQYRSPEAIDEVLHNITGIEDAAGFVAEDSKGQQFLACAAVKSEGSRIKEEDILAHCASKLPKDLAPQAVTWIDSIPHLRGLMVNRLSITRQFRGLLTPASERPVPIAQAKDLTSAPDPIAVAKAGFVPCALQDLPAGEPLPITIHVYYASRFLPFRKAGAVIDRNTFDQMELKGYTQLFVPESEQPALTDFLARHKPPDADVKQEPVLKEARTEERQRLFEVFQSEHPNAAVRQALEASKNLVASMMKSPFSTQPLNLLQVYAKGTLDHSVNVSVLSTYLALQLGFTHHVILQHISAGGLLHDIGKAKLFSQNDSPEETKKKMQQHPTLGAKMLEGMGNFPREVILIVSQHHEFHDGSGYPEGLRGNNIYELARIVALTNVFEDLVFNGKGTLKERQANAINELETNYSRKFEAVKLSKILKVLKMGI